MAERLGVVQVVQLHNMLRDLELQAFQLLDASAAPTRDKKSLRLSLQTHVHLLRRSLNDVEKAVLK